ncbi:MAG TPA: peptidylprolyl isomerase [Bacteroidales bacterium]|nr:peptidylprolyl isomerase [Bacteroidales bacterium]
MNISIKRIILINILFVLISCSAPGGNENTFVSITTTLGTIKIRLYDETPIHRDNFIKLVKSGLYDDVSFHRVIKDFMIQAGDPLTKANHEGLNDSLSTYTLPAEFRSQYFHKRGALAAARQGNDVNPEMRSSGTQFYIVQGTKLTYDELNEMELRINSSMKQTYFNQLLKEVADSAEATGKTLTPGEVQEIASIKMFNYLTDHKDFKIQQDHRDVYMSEGGVPRLDGTYTVFGEVVEGMDVVDSIAAVETDESDKPVSDVKIIRMKIVKN